MTELKAGPPPDIGRDEAFTQTQEPGSSKRVKMAKHRKVYRKIPKFLDARKPFCNQAKIQTKMPNLRVFHPKDANGKANNEYPDQTAPLGAV